MHGITGKDIVSIPEPGSSPLEQALEGYKQRSSGDQKIVELLRGTQTDQAGVGLLYSKQFNYSGAWEIYGLVQVRYSSWNTSFERSFFSADIGGSPAARDSPCHSGGCIMRERLVGVETMLHCAGWSRQGKRQRRSWGLAARDYGRQQ